MSESQKRVTSIVITSIVEIVKVLDLGVYVTSILSSYQLLNFDTLEEKKTIKVTQCALRMTYLATHVTQTRQADGVKHTS